LHPCPATPPLALHRFVVVDCETTGLDPEKDRLVEIAAVRFEGGEPTETYATLVDPGLPIPPIASGIHFIADDDVAGAPGPQEALAGIARFVGDAIIVAHNAPFDRSFLPSLDRNEWLCSYRFARHLWPNAPSHKNAVLRFWLRVRHPALVGIAAHRAEGDAITTGLIFQAGLREYSTATPYARARDLIEFIGSPVHVERFNYGRKHANWKLADIPAQYLEWGVRDSTEPEGTRRLKNLDDDTLWAVKFELHARSTKDERVAPFSATAALS
jgi:DNA polymerase III epsilon subunit-like protein